MRTLGIMSFLVVAFVLLSSHPARGLSEDPLRERLRNRIEAAGVPPQLSVGDERILANGSLPLFYSERLYRPAWSRNGNVLETAYALVRSVRDASLAGLDPEDYHLSQIERTLALASDRAAPSGLLVDLDLLLSDAFLLYGSHLLTGSVNPITFDPEWHVAPSRRRDLLELLSGIAEGKSVARAIEDLEPEFDEYRRLKLALTEYRAIAGRGGWPNVPDGAKLEAGVEDPRVALLKLRLTKSGDLAKDGSSDNLFDETLADSVKRFQARHGLEVDGVAGPRTFEMLNVPVAYRVRQIELSLERWRWLPDELGRGYILVNIPSFALELVEDGSLVLEMRAVVGKPYRRTPVFSGKMSYLVLSPYWHVPPTIAIQDVLPELRKDVSYLAHKRMHVFMGWGADAQEIDPTSVSWADVSPRSFPYRFRQEPGPLNALGGIKFMFPNPFNVYLHDTPSRELFARPDRSFSSGCIRIQKPVDLAEYLLGPEWPRARILASIERGEEQTVRIPSPVDVHLLYLTSWVDGEGTVHFRRDIYDRDRLLDAAMKAGPPRPSKTSAGAS